MEYSFPHYLLSKQSVDDRALNKDVLNALKAILPQQSICIIEVGAGIGTKQLGVGLRWTRSMVATVPFSQLGNSPFMGGKQSTLAITVDLGIQ